jgi:hypothetical protein
MNSLDFWTLSHASLTSSDIDYPDGIAIAAHCKAAVRMTPANHRGQKGGAQFFTIIPEQRVRVTERNGEPSFVASDVALTLGYAQPDRAVRDHCKARQTCPVKTPGQVRHFIIIPERDVYRLIMRSKLPEVERFEEGVVGEDFPVR